MRDHDGLGELRVIGRPGCGKTTFLARQIAFDAQRRGPEAVVAVSHTNAAAKELAGRDLPIPRGNVGTLHSLAYRALGKPPLAQTPELIAEFNAHVHPRLRIDVDAEAGARDLEPRLAEGDALLCEYERYRNLMAPLPPRLAPFAKVWEDFKRQTGSIDFCDMIEFALRDVAACPGDPEVLIADEVQDCSALQLALLWRWGARAEKLITCIDADQSIYGFSGADPEIFTRNPARDTKVLGQSYRVPKAVHAWACEWIERNKSHVITPYYPTPAEGAVETIGACYRDPDLVLPHITAAIDEGATIMVLASCGYMLVPLLAALRRASIPYWNPYRRDQSAWNPLGRRGPGTTLDAIAAFLAYWRDGKLSWTHDQLAAWLEITTGVVRRGMKQQLPQLLDLGDRPAAPYLLERIFTPEALSWWSDPFSGALDLDAGCKWLAERLVKSRQGVGRYALGLAAEHGPDVLDAAPKTIVGTIHCSPPDEPVLTATGRWVPIGDLNPDVDRLVGYDAKSRSLNMSCGLGRKGTPRGMRMTGAPFIKGSSHFSGDLVVMRTARSHCRVTPDHRVVVRYSDDFYEKWVVYLMRRGPWWRVGICISAHRPYVTGSVLGRLATEQADAGWVLGIHGTRREALMHEAVIQGKYGIPGLTFESAKARSLSSADLHAIHDATKREVGARAHECLRDHGLLADHPLYVRVPGGKARGMASYWFETVAANVITRMMEVPVCTTVPGKARTKPEALPVTVTREAYDGEVISLQVHPYEHYVSGGQVVHNSVKGGEADRVLLFPDLSTSAWQQWHDARGREEVRRVFYVGATRARDRLLLAEPTTTMAVPWR